MGLNRFLQLFIPKESKFFPLLRGQVEDILKASNLLIEFTKTEEHYIRKELYNQIKELESHCDTLTLTVFEELNHTFITPFDREDIHNLTAQLDDVMDLINDAAKRTILYKPDQIPPELTKMAELIKECALCLEIAIGEIDKVRKNPKIVIEQSANIHRIETTADNEYEMFLIKLFRHEQNAIELIKQMEIIQMMESAVDKAEDVADIIRTIIVKYA